MQNVRLLLQLVCVNIKFMTQEQQIKTEKQRTDLIMTHKIFKKQKKYRYYIIIITIIII